MTAFSTALGWMAVRWRDGQVARNVFGYSSRRSAENAVGGNTASTGQLSLSQQHLVDRLREMAAGDPVDFADVVLDTSGMTRFQRQIVATCRTIPPGQTISYGELARQAGHAGAARAVGSVMANNPFPLIVPCHRVVSSNRLGGFSAPGGVTTKQKLLDLEKKDATTPDR